MNLSDYYASAAVRARMTEFLGSCGLDAATAAYVTATPASRDLPADVSAPSGLIGWLDRGADVSRSLWDRDAVVVHLDIDYVHFDLPGEAYRDPARMFEVIRPTIEAISRVCATFGIEPLQIVSGRGQHFVWRVRRGTSTFHVLADLGRVHPSLASRYAAPHAPKGEPVDPELGAAFSGLGMVMEFFAHLVVLAASSHTSIPTMLTAVEVGPGAHGREEVAIDISEYADPLHVRVMRIPFSVYRKPEWQRGSLGDELVSSLPPMVAVPMDGASLAEAITATRDLDMARTLASEARTGIPDASEAMWGLVTAYLRSTLHAFHLEFYDQPSAPPAEWEATRGELPPCVTILLDRPNDLLLKPAGIQHLVRSLLALGWHARQVAGLIRSAYEADHAWGALWRDYDAFSRADFYTRLFAGLVATGLDEGVDFNCRSAQEKGYCPSTGCDYDLTLLRPSLLSKKSIPPRHASYPFRVLDRLLLPV